MGGTTRDMAKDSFSLLARKLGCPDDASPEEEVEFVRGRDAGAILGCFRSHNDSGMEPRMFFRPQVDGRILLGPDEHFARAKLGRFAKIVSCDFFLFGRRVVLIAKADIARYDCRRWKRSGAV